MNMAAAANAVQPLSHLRIKSDFNRLNFMRTAREIFEEAGSNISKEELSVALGFMVYLGISQKELAEAVGCSTATMSRWVAGTDSPPLHAARSVVYKKFMRLLDLKIEALAQSAHENLSYGISAEKTRPVGP